MGRLLKLIILIIVFYGFWWLFSHPLNKIGVDMPYFSPPAEDHKIDAEELSSFLDLWSRMMQSGLKQKVAQVSLRSADSQYPQELVKWLEAQNWNVERFFYNEQRLAEIVDCVNLRKSYKSNVKLAKQSKLGEIVKDLKQKLEVCSYDDDEMALVEANLYQITEIFAGRAVLGKSND
ncbi:MAG: hypothetical protein E7020_03990 [Alphaproteobacteria bacterium]|nr:hypothetical protein [Alphaproteobacteria bacterium]